MLAACGGEESEPDTHRVVITDRGYDPASLQIEVGDRVTFVNRSEKQSHTAKDDAGGYIDVSPHPGPTRHDGSEVGRATRKGFATHALFPGEEQTIVFPVVRRYHYRSAFNWDLNGRINVGDSD